MKVSTADFIKNYGALADKALSEPVTITKNGRDRRVVRVEDFTAEEIAQIAAAEVPPGYEHLDDELKDWNP